MSGEPNDPSQLSLIDLFRGEVDSHTSTLNGSLLELERSPDPRQALQTLMRAAHSIKGAARIVGLLAASKVAHAMEDCFVAAQRGKVELRQTETDVLLRSTDLLAQLAKRSESEILQWENDCAKEIAECVAALELVAQKRRSEVPPEVPVPTSPGEVKVQPKPNPPPPLPAISRKPDSPERVVRLTAESLNRLLGLAGESLVESRWLRPFTDSLQKLKRQQIDIIQKLDELRESMAPDTLPEPAKSRFQELTHMAGESRRFLASRLQELDTFDRRSAQLSHRLYLEVLRTRMRPFGDGVRRFPRMVRDLARTLNKEVRLEVSGETTQVDREILERLETPLGHLLRNAVDHGCESRVQREASGKAPENVIRLEARHSAGILLVSVSDDGAGVATDRLRQVIVDRGLATAAEAEKMSESDLLEFLFLPGITLRDTVTEISGRGVGLDVVQNMVRSVRGSIRMSNQPGRGLRVQLQLPLTLSVLRAMLVEVDKEPYALPLSQIHRTVTLAREGIEQLEGHCYFRMDGQTVRLVCAQQVLDCGKEVPLTESFAVVVLNDRTTRYGLIVDRFLGERELVVQPLDARLGKIRDVSSAALMEDGSPILVLDVEDLLKSIERSEPLMLPLSPKPALPPAKTAKRVLAVDDSQVVRELVRNLLVTRGYDVDVAIDGGEAWNAVRRGSYDLVITDLEMPSLDGLGLTTLIKRDPELRSTPVLVVSCKDGEDNRLRGLKAGADSYLGKGSFTNEKLLEEVSALIGSADPASDKKLGKFDIAAQNQATQAYRDDV